MLDAQLPGKNKFYDTSITAADGTQAKILVEESPPHVLPQIAGEGPLPGEATVRPRMLTGGQRVFDGCIASSDATARSVRLWFAAVLTRAPEMGAASINSQNTLSRTTGSFLIDGWRVGETLMLFGAATPSNNGVPGQITALSALALTVNGAPFTNETIAADTRLARVSQRTQRAVPINAGNNDSVPPVLLIGGSQDPAAFPAPDTGWSLDQDTLVAVSAVATISALPARLDFQASSVLY